MHEDVDEPRELDGLVVGISGAEGHIDVEARCPGCLAEPRRAYLHEHVMGDDGDPRHLVEGYIERVEIEDHVVGVVEAAGPAVPGVDLYAAEVCHVDEGRFVLAQEVGDVPALRPRMDFQRFHPAGDGMVDVFLEEAGGRDAVGMAMERFRPVLQIGEDEGRDGPVVGDHVSLCVSVFRPEHLIEIGQVDLHVVDGDELPLALPLLLGPVPWIRPRGRLERQFFSPFSPDVGRGKVLSQPQEDGLSHQPLVRPL